MQFFYDALNLGFERLPILDLVDFRLRHLIRLQYLDSRLNVPQGARIGLLQVLDGSVFVIQKCLQDFLFAFQHRRYLALLAASSGWVLFSASSAG